MIRSPRLPGPGAPRLGRVNWIGMATLYRREVWRAAREMVDGLLGPVVTNLLFLAVFRLALGEANWPIPDISLAAFVAPALVLFAVAERALTSASGSILFDKYTGILGDLTMAPLTPLERVVGHAGGAATAGLMTGGVTALVLLPFAGATPAAPLAALFFAAATGLLFALIGIVVGLWARRWDHHTIAHSFLFIPPAYFSGMFYPVEGLPEIGRAVVRLNPFFYGLDGFRAGVTGWQEADTTAAAAVLLLTILAVGFLAHRLLAVGYRVKA
jgi:ABC-2 type transport system permease protein